MTGFSPDPNAQYYVYFLLSHDSRDVKIGYTANPARRLYELRREYFWMQEPRPTKEQWNAVRYVGFVEGGYEREMEIQSRFRHCGHWDGQHLGNKNEWFRLEADLIEFILTQTCPIPLCP